MIRRTMLNAALAAAFTLALPMIVRAARAAEPGPKPNIVYIVADDLGWKDVGFHGS